MEDFDYEKFIKVIENYTKKNYRARIFNGKLVPNVANLGGNVDDIVKLEIKSYQKFFHYCCSISLLL